MAVSSKSGTGLFLTFETKYRSASWLQPGEEIVARSNDVHKSRFIVSDTDVSLLFNDPVCRNESMIYLNMIGLMARRLSYA